MSKHLDLWFEEDDDRCVLHVEAKDSIGAMALKYFESESKEHGMDKVVKIHTDPRKRSDD